MKEKDTAPGIFRMTRRDFLRFFAVGGLFGLAGRKIMPDRIPRKAMFWRKVK
ncbi:MAG: twin-arginine translocation signal domain-containing protein [Nitrospirae bacterium]|nr:twin-arginine translocation signal domain-containing protein [Nitrospirota bacterium]